MSNDTTINLRDIIVSTVRGLNSSVVKTDGDYRIRLIKTKDIGNDGLFLTGTVDQEYIEKSDLYEKSIVSSGDVIISLRGKLKASLIPEDAKGFFLSNNLIGIDCKDKYNPVILVAYLNSDLGVAELEKNAVGSVNRSLNLNSIKNVKIPNFNQNEQENLSALIKDLNQFLKIIEKEKKIFETSINTIFSEKMGRINDDHFS